MSAPGAGLAPRILIGMAVGAVAGALLGEAAAPAVRAIEAVGTIFLRLLLALVLPLASAALILGVLELQPRALVRVGTRALALTLALTGIAVAIGLGTVTLFQPGRGMDRAALPAAAAVKPAAADAVDLVVGLFPSNVVQAAAENNLVAVLVFAVIVGVALRGLQTEGANAVRTLVVGLFEVSGRAVGLVLQLAPIGVAALTFALVARTGLAGLLPLGRYVGVVLLGLGLQLFVVYPLALRFVAGRDPVAFFRGARPAMAVAFSTASSAASLPSSLRVAEEGLGIPPETARFVLTVGATGNQNGTALFEGVTVLFIAQLYGVELSLAQQAAVVGVSIVGGIGTAGVPGGALPVIAAVLATLGIPPEGVGVIVGVDRLLDMCRTTLNVTGDLVIAATVAGRDAQSAEG